MISDGAAPVATLPGLDHGPLSAGGRAAWATNFVIGASFVLMTILCTMENHSRVGRIIFTVLPLILIGFSAWRGWLPTAHLRRFLAPLVAVSLAIMLSSLTSIDPAFSIENFTQQHLWYMALFVGVGAWAVTPGRQRVFLWGLAMAGLFSAVMGVLLYYFATDWAERGIIDKWDDFIYQAQTAGGETYYRAEGLLQSYTRSAMVFFVALPATCALLTDGLRRRRWFLVAICLLIAFFSGWYLLLTKARGAWIATALACYVVLALLRCPWYLLLGIPLLGLLALVVLPAERQRAMTLVRDLDNPDLLLSGRLDLWKQGQNPITENLWAGVGYGGNIFLTDAAEESGYALQNDVKQPDLHNLYMQTLAEVGIIGIVMYAWLMGVLLQLGFRLVWFEYGKPELSGAAVSLASLIAILFIGIVYYMNEDHIAQLLWSTAGLIAGGAALFGEKAAVGTEFDA